MSVKSLVTNIKELKRPCVEVKKNEDIEQIVTDLKDTLATKNGYALASNQIGYNKKIALIKIAKNLNKTEFNEYLLINPKIVEKNTKILFPETCLSFPGIKVYTDRYVFISLENQDIKGEITTSLAQDLEAIILQHEIDHLNGITMFDRKHKDVNRRR